MRAHEQRVDRVADQVMKQPEGVHWDCIAQESESGRVAAREVSVGPGLRVFPFAVAVGSVGVGSCTGGSDWDKLMVTGLLVHTRTELSCVGGASTLSTGCSPARLVRGDCAHFPAKSPCGLHAVPGFLFFSCPFASSPSDCCIWLRK